MEIQNEMPSDVLLALSKACLSRDVEIFKQHLSERVFAQGKIQAEINGVSLDEYIERNVDFASPLKNFIEILGEKIGNDEATIDFRYAGSADSARAMFVNENGEWKFLCVMYLDFDRKKPAETGILQKFFGKFFRN